MFSSILAFDFDIIMRSFLTFWGPNELFSGSGLGSKTVLGCNLVVEQLSFLAFFLTFWSPNGQFLGSE